MGLWAWLKSKYTVIVNRKSLQPCMHACRPAGRVHAMHKNEIMTVTPLLNDELRGIVPALGRLESGCCGRGGASGQDAGQENAT